MIHDLNRVRFPPAHFLIARVYSLVLRGQHLYSHARAHTHTNNQQKVLKIIMQKRPLLNEKRQTWMKERRVFVRNGTFYLYIVIEARKTN